MSPAFVESNQIFVKHNEAIITEYLNRFLARSAFFAQLLVENEEIQTWNDDPCRAFTISFVIFIYFKQIGEPSIQSSWQYLADWLPINNYNWMEIISKPNTQFESHKNYVIENEPFKVICISFLYFQAATSKIIPFKRQIKVNFIRWI